MQTLRRDLLSQRSSIAPRKPSFQRPSFGTSNNNQRIQPSKIFNYNLGTTAQPTTSGDDGLLGRRRGSRRTDSSVACAAASSPQQPQYDGRGSAPQEQLLQQTALRTAWSTHLSTFLGLISRLLAAARTFLLSCADVLPQFTVLSPAEAARRMILILAASLLMIVVLTTIDSALLYTYVRHARYVPFR